MHDGIGVGIAASPFGQASLRGVVPVAFAIAEHATVGYTYPTTDAVGHNLRFKFIGVSHYGVAVATIGHIHTIHAIVWTCDVAGTAHTSVVGHGQFIIG